MNQGGFNQDYYNRTDSAADSATPEVRHETVLTDAPFLTGFTSCKSHVIAATEEQTNYPVRIVIHRSSGTDSGQDVYVGASGCLATYADIRFTAADGSTLLDYAFPPDITPDSSSATVDVLVPSLSVGNTTIRIYYGNSDASDASSPDNTYLLYDHFTGSSLDGSKWSEPLGSFVSVSGSVATLELSAPSARALVSASTGIVAENTIFTARLASYHTSGVNEWLYLYDTSIPSPIILAYLSVVFGSSQIYENYSGGYTDAAMAGWSTGSYHVLELTRNGASNWDVDDANPVTISANYSTAAAQLYFYLLGTGAKITIDYIYGRKYSSTVSHGAWATIPALKTLDSYTAYYTNETYLYFLNGSVVFTPGENVTGATSGVTGVVREVTVLAGSWAGGDAQGYMIVVGAAAQFQHENITGNLGGTAHTEGRTVSISQFDYTAGSGIFSTNETLTGASSGATGTVVSWTFDTGDYGAGTATGTLKLIDATPGFLLHEGVTGSVSGAATLSGGSYTESCPMLATTISISKRMGDALWVARMELAGTYVAPGNSQCTLYMADKDTGDAPQLLFAGILTDQDYSLQEGSNRTTVTGYSKAWYLSKQYLNLDYPLYWFNLSETTTEVPPAGIYMDATVAPGCETHIDPRLLVTQFVEDADMTVGTISDSTEWADQTIKRSEFRQFDRNSTRKDVIDGIGEYLNFMFHESFSNENSVAHFVSNDDIDILLGLPSPVTFTNPDQYILGQIRIEKRKGELYNRIVVRGKPTMITDTVTISSTSDQTIALSQLGVSGTWGVTVNGTDYTGNCTENLSGSDVVSLSITGLVATGTALIYFMPATKYYESIWEHADIGDGKPVIQAPPYESDDIQTQEQCDTVCNALVQYYTTDPNVYHATFDRRTDLRLLQKVTLIGFPGVPEDQMRITGIEYQQTGPFVKVNCELCSETHLSAQRRLKRITGLDTLSVIEAIIEKRLKAINANEPTEFMLIAGKAAIVKNQFNILRKGLIT